ncbi:hypothetical protein [Fontivita pretiosa]|uniref:hypothetical protein n=1 Tax=Fontivita pretiosa TaxID=2989684 RepID=UPI003D168153
MNTSNFLRALLFALTLTPTVLSQQANLRHQDFSTDPGWEGFRNRLVPVPAKITRQDFGWRDTNHAKGVRPGEIGGWIQRSVTPAYYAMPIPVKTFNDKLVASGKFAVTRDDGNSGMLFGFFNDKSRGWRTPNSLTFRIDGNGGKYWVFFEYGTQHWLSGGIGCFEGERYQTTRTKPFLADGTVHTWKLSYDPDAAAGKGQVTFTLDDKTYTLALADGHKADGATFNRFGMFNQQTSGSGMEVYFDDLMLDGKPIDLDGDPKWDALGNQVEFEDRLLRPYHDFGYSPDTTHAGGGRGEIGGAVWRDEAGGAYYADAVGPLSLDDEIHASGKVAFTAAGSDSGAFIGFFDSQSKRSKTTPHHVEPDRNVLAILIEGPSRVGHYFRPACYNRDAKGEITAEGPLIRPDGQVHQWSMDYSPTAADGRGRITVRFDDHVQTYDLAPGIRQAGATFDRFGIFNIHSGGHFVQVWFDDLSYTVKPRSK